LVGGSRLLIVKSRAARLCATRWAGGKCDTRLRSGKARMEGAKRREKLEEKEKKGEIP
jgi:hypothetical protein